MGKFGAFGGPKCHRFGGNCLVLSRFGGPLGRHLGVNLGPQERLRPPEGPPRGPETVREPARGLHRAPVIPRVTEIPGELPPRRFTDLFPLTSGSAVRHCSAILAPRSPPRGLGSGRGWPPGVIDGPKRPGRVRGSRGGCDSGRSTTSRFLPLKMLQETRLARPDAKRTTVHLGTGTVFASTHPLRHGPSGIRLRANPPGSNLRTCAAGHPVPPPVSVQLYPVANSGVGKG